jgi:hypothetical protein
MPRVDLLIVFGDAVPTAREIKNRQLLLKILNQCRTAATMIDPQFPLFSYLRLKVHW